MSSFGEDVTDAMAEEMARKYWGKHWSDLPEPQREPEKRRMASFLRFAAPMLEQWATELLERERTGHTATAQERDGWKHRAEVAEEALAEVQALVNDGVRHLRGTTMEGDMVADFIPVTSLKRALVAR